MPSRATTGSTRVLSWQARTASDNVTVVLVVPPFAAVTVITFISPNPASANNRYPVCTR
jgi:hypothetical protein